MAATITLNKLNHNTTMTEIVLNGKAYQLDWTFMSEEYVEQLNQNKVLERVGNLGKAACLAVAALRGGDWTFDKGPDWVLAQIGKDGKKLEELSTKVMACIKEFNELNGRETEQQGNAQAPSEGAKD